MNNLTQTDLDKMVEDFKQGVIDDLQQKNLTLEQALAKGNPEILLAFVKYQEEVIPAANTKGYKVKTLSELFSLPITLSIQD